MSVGDTLLLYSQKQITVKSVKREELEKPVKVYNFEVEDLHTYFVSKYNILVHNSCEGPYGVYTLRDPNNIKIIVYVGRTKDLDRRESEHSRDLVKGKYFFKREFENISWEASRGLEQKFYDVFGKDSPLEYLINRIRPVRVNNANAPVYMAATDKYGDISDRGVSVKR